MKEFKIKLPDSIAEKIEEEIECRKARFGDRFLENGQILQWGSREESIYEYVIVKLKEPDGVKLARLTVKVWNRLYPGALADVEKEQLKLANKVISDYERGGKTS